MVLTETKTEQEKATTEVVLEKPVAKSYFGSISVEPAEKPLFEIEKEYNNFELPESARRSQMLPEFDILPSSKARSTAKVDAAIKKDLHLSLRGKIIATVASMITVLLLTLVIYNAVVLGSKKAEINSLSALLATNQAELAQLEADLQTAQSEEEIAKLLKDSGSALRKATNADKIKISVESYSASKYSAPTNWFDKICEFLSNLFR